MSIKDANGIDRPSKANGDHQVEVDTTSRDYMSFHEATRDPIFLFQVRVVLGVNAQNLSDNEYYHDGDTLWIDAERFLVEEIKLASKENRMLRKKDNEDLPFEIGISISDDEMVDNDWASAYWDTRSVFRSRTEAVEYGISQRHNYGKEGEGWRVYCVPCEGELATVLRHVDRKEVVAFVQGQTYKDALTRLTKSTAKV